MTHKAGGYCHTSTIWRIMHQISNILYRLTPFGFIIYRLYHTVAMMHRFAVTCIHSYCLLKVNLYNSGYKFSASVNFFSQMNRYYGMHPTCTIVYYVSTLTVCANLNAVVSVNNSQLCYKALCKIIEVVERI